MCADELDRGLRSVVRGQLAGGTTATARAYWPTDWVHASEAARREEARRLTSFLWARGADADDAATFITAIRDELLVSLFANEPALADQREQVAQMVAASGPDDTLSALDLADLGGRDGSPTQSQPSHPTFCQGL
jgi:hypothetical protein